jgi:diguanylate cyclase (GGDEF)-like protein/PAS domain S-box-containing protein
MSPTDREPIVTRPLRLLHLEDSPRDAELVRHRLQSSGLRCDTVVAESKDSFEAALIGSTFDLILVDYNLPGYDGMRALKLAQRTQPDVPVILISGTVGEEEAVKSLQFGATDYLLKVRLDRLVPAVERALREAETRRKQKRVEAALGESESRKAAILESVLDCIITMDADGTVLEFNAAAVRTFGYTKSDAIGRNIADLIIPPRLREQHRDSVGRAMAAGDGPSIGKVIEIVAMKADASEIPVELAITAVDSSAASVFTAVLRDITSRQQADATRARLAAIVDSSEDAIFGMALDDTILTWNAGAERLYGYAAAEVIGRSHALLVPPERRAELRSIMERAAGGCAGEHVETQRLRKDGSLIDISLVISPMTDATGRVTGVSKVGRDIGGRKEAEAEVKRLGDELEWQRRRELEVAHALSIKMAHFAQYDVLTDLPNRTLFDDRIAQAIAMAHRQGTQLAVMFVDLDLFKQVNDSLGHAVGDMLLQSVTARLLACVRESDTVSRFGGDEFVVLLPRIVAGSAEVVADKLLRALAAPHEISGHVLHITASVGISLYPDDALDAAALIGAADNALYHAKQTGRNSFQFFTSQMNARRVARRSLEGGLRDALSAQQFVLHYQPKFTLAARHMTGVEALIRWQHPTAGLMAPGAFIAVAEECGLIVSIGRWVLRESCRQARAWQDAGLPSTRVAINVSALEFRASGFVENVTAVLRETGLDASLLEVEVTESVLMGDTASARTALFALKSLGVRLAIDDFGTGYSSLSYLSRFPIDSLKIDRSFVHGMETAAHDVTIIAAVIAMGRSLKHCVVAEGVETAEQLTMLQALACDEGQGYHLSRPMDGAQLTTRLREGPPLDALEVSLAH